MISRRTTLLVAGLLESAFRRHNSRTYGTTYYTINSDAVYDFLFENDYPAWFCNLAKAAHGSSSTRPFTDFVLKIHTGESIASATKEWSWKQRERRGQQLLKELAEDIIKQLKGNPRRREVVNQRIRECERSLELDGFKFEGDVLLIPEADVLDVAEEAGVLQSLYENLRLSNKDRVFHHLKLSEEHYLASRWDDSISNSRKFLEGVLQEVAKQHHLTTKGTEIPMAVYERPVRVREFLESSGILESKEMKTLASVYGLLSETGGHPYMARNDQARLLRHLALTFSQFVLLRLQGSKNV